MEKNTFWKPNRKFGAVALLSVRSQRFLEWFEAFTLDLLWQRFRKKWGEVIRKPWRKWLRTLTSKKEWLLPPRKQPFLVLFPACWFGNQLSDFIQEMWSQKEIPCWKLKEVIELSFVQYDNTNVCTIEIEANRVNPQLFKPRVYPKVLGKLPIGMEISTAVPWFGADCQMTWPPR